MDTKEKVNENIGIIKEQIGKFEVVKEDSNE